MAKDLGISVLIDYYGPLLTEKQLEVVGLYYDEDLSLSEISEHAGITRQGVRDCIKRAEQQLLHCEEKLGHARRFARIQRGLDEIAAEAAALLEENGRAPYALRLEERAARILEIKGSLDPEDKESQ